MGANCSWENNGSVAVLKIHAGKVNAFSHDLISELHQAFDDIQSNDDIKSVVLTGQEGIFSAGFDLKVMKSGPKEAGALIKAGGELLCKMHLYPKPLIMAVSGHAMAMGSITLFTGDVRIGAEGSFKLGLNETAIGMALPRLAIALAQDRLRPTMISRAVIIGEIFDPKGAVEAGYLDMTAPADKLLDTAIAYAEQIGASVEPKAFLENKKRIRAATLEAVAGIWD